MMHESGAMNHRLHVGASSSPYQVQHHAACVPEVSQHAICVLGIHEYVLISRFQVQIMIHQHAACDPYIKIRASYAGEIKGGFIRIHTCCIHYRPSIWMIQSITSAVSSFLLHET